MALANRFIELGYTLVGGKTENHLLILNVKKSLGITGKVGENVLDEVCITCNKNTVPFDEEKPFIASGLRIGTASVTTRGMKEQDMITIANLIDKALKNKDDKNILNEVKNEVIKLTKKYPLYNK